MPIPRRIVSMLSISKLSFEKEKKKSTQRKRDFIKKNILRPGYFCEFSWKKHLFLFAESRKILKEDYCAINKIGQVASVQVSGL